MDKAFLKSKTVWAGIIIAGAGILKAFGIDIPIDIVVSIAGAFGLYGIRDAIDKNK